MNKAPWKDFAGNDIHEGDTLQHPSGERGKVVFLPHESDPSDQWRVDYGDGNVSRLCLQVGDKGQAVVTPNVVVQGQDEAQLRTVPLERPVGREEG